MNLSVSNIAWEDNNDSKIFKLLKRHGVSGIEIAPTKIWEGWKNASFKKAKEYKVFLEDLGFQIPAIQAILFGKEDLQLFHPSSHPKFFNHIKLVAELAEGLSSNVLVFGAPKNRRRGKIPYNDAVEMAVDFFFKAAEICKEHKCYFAIEHNPAEYGCDFINNVSEAKAIVKRVNNPFFKLHLDSGGIHMSGEDIKDAILQAGEFVHYHISEPMLREIYKGVVNHKKGIEALKSINYQNWVSIEMKQPSSIRLLEQSVTYIKNILMEIN